MHFEKEFQNLIVSLHASVTNAFATLNDWANLPSDSIPVQHRLTDCFKSLDNTIQTHLSPTQNKDEAWIPQLTSKIRNMGVNMKIKQLGKVREIPSQYSEPFFKIALEIATNSIKHGNASIINILIIFQPNSINMTFSDNGQGVTSTDLQSSSVGLTNLHDRATAIDSVITRTTASNGSLSTHLKCPWPTENSNSAPQTPPSTGQELHDVICPQIMAITFTIKSLTSQLSANHAQQIYLLSQWSESFSELFRTARSLSHKLIAQQI